MDVQPGHGAQQGVRLRPVPAQRGQHRHVAGQHAAGQRGEHPVRAHLEVRGAAVRPQRGERVGEADGVAGVPDPVAGRADGGHVDGRAGDGGDQRHGRGVVRQPGGDLGQLVEHRFHERAVERVADGEPAGAYPPVGPLGGDPRDGVGGPGDHHGRRAVDGGDGDPVAERGTHVVLARGDREHRPAVGQRLHEPAPGGDQFGGVGEGEDPGGVGGGELPDGVPGDRVRAQAPGGEQPVQRHLDGEQGRLGELGAVQQRRLVGAGVGVEQRAQRPGQVRVQRGARLRQRVGVDRVRGGQLPTHAGPLRALPGEEVRDPGSGGHRAGHQGRRVGAGGERAEPGAQRPAVGGEHDRAVFQGGPGHGGGPADVDQRGRRRPGEPVGPRLGLGGQRPGGTGGQQHRHHRQVHRFAGRRRRFGCLFEDGVGVGAADAEGGDGGAARPAGQRPGPPLGEQVDRAGAPVHLVAGRVDVQRRRQVAVA